MGNPNPCVATRFKPGHGPMGGRPKTAWIVKRLTRPEGPDGKAEAEQILEHQIEVAKSWEVRTVATTADGEPIKVASGRDSTEAAKLLFGLVGYLRKPEAGETELALAMAEHMRKIEADRVNIAFKILGDERIRTMPSEELVQFVRDCASNPAGYLDLAARKAAEIDSSAALRLEALAEMSSGKPELDGETTDEKPAKPDTESCAEPEGAKP